MACFKCNVFLWFLLLCTSHMVVVVFGISHKKLKVRNIGEVVIVHDGTCNYLLFFFILLARPGELEKLFYIDTAVYSAYAGVFIPWHTFHFVSVL